MPNSEFTAIWQLIHPVAKDRPLLSHAVNRLDHFGKVVSRKQLELANRYQRDENQLMKTLVSALGSRVTGCVAIPVGQSKDPRLTGNEACLLASGLLIGECFWQALWTRYRYWWTTGLDKAFGQDFKKSLRQAVLKTAGDSIEVAVTNAVKGTVWHRHRASLQNGMWDAVIYYLGFAALGDKKIVSLLEPLVGSIFVAPPLCDRNEAPGNWIVLTG